tara:strand:+ start:172 stop:327 length:156 start_codon:yes stop_codon:yes gene_type:complete
MTKKKRDFLEMLVENGESTEKIMEWKDYWDWKEVTPDEIEERLKQERKPDA